MCDGHNNTVEDAQRDESEFAIVISTIQHCYCYTAKKGLEISEINAVLSKIRLPFLLVLFKLHITL